MAFSFDNYDNALVIDGWEKGIADSPFAGLSDMRNMNIISIPGEVSVNFATTKISAASFTGTMTNSSASGDTVTLTNPPNQNAAIYFLTVSDATKGISINTPYWIVPSAGNFQLYSDYPQASLVNITGDSLTGTWATYNMGQPKYFAYASKEAAPAYWMVDANGLVWSNAKTTSPGSFWTYTGNKPNNNSHGNGLLYVSASDNTGYMFVFSDGSVDFTPTSSSAITWTYQWVPSAGTAGSFSANPSTVLKTSTAVHEGLWAPDGTAYYCDGNYISTFFQTIPATPFVPTTKATYTYATYELLPNDTSTCLTFLGLSILVGGKNNTVYVWDRFSPLPSSYILIPEFNVHRMVTVNTNTYIFVGNRGRIYTTNGTNAMLYKKLPDHISGTIEPYFTWGGACSVKNQLYFSALGTANDGTAINQYGGVWAIDLDTDALRLTNVLSYGTYAGYVPAMIPNFASNAAGTGLFLGWDNNASGYGVDTTLGTPYTTSVATIDTDLIPIGTYQKPRDFTKLEYKLSRPLVSGESIVIKTRLVFNTQDSGYTTTLSDSTVGNYSNISDINFKNAQWVQFQIILNSTGTTPSYVRLKHIRILGLTGPTMAQNQILSI